jgi:hypothetical protein
MYKTLGNPHLQCIKENQRTLKQLELENKDNLVETYTKQKAGILVVIA